MCSAESSTVPDSLSSLQRKLVRITNPDSLKETCHSRRPWKLWLQRRLRRWKLAQKATETGMSGLPGIKWCKLQRSSLYLGRALQSLCDSSTCTAANLNLSRCTAALRIWLHERQHPDSQDEADFTAPSHPKRGRRFQSFSALGCRTNANNSESRNLESRAKGRVRAQSGSRKCF